ncbi:MAG: magnesium transporter [Bacteroidetes bacterium]|jgi:magnesium transporter|nr:magnesium transporter [Bacteroidota bacterium]
MNFELTREYINELQSLIDQKDEVEVYKLIKDLHPADIAEIYEELNVDEAKFIYYLLDTDLAADVLVELEDDTREKFLEALPGDIIARQYIENMDSDDAADIIQELSDEKQNEVLRYIDNKAQAGDIADLLNYDEHTAGGMMAKELVKVNENWELITATREMRKQAGELEEVYYVYVVDDNNILKGTVSLKRMLLSRPNALIKNIMEEDVISVQGEAPSEEVINLMEKYDLVALPVIDPVGRLIGRITIDDVVDVMKEEAEKDYQLISGITQDVESSDKTWVLTKARLPWLLIGLVGGILGALVIGNYETDLGLYPQMAFFVPLVAAMGGNVGVQSSAIIVQGLANNTLGLESTWSKLLKELLIALINGMILASITLLFNILVNNSMALTLTVSFALLLVIIFASMFGTFIPLILNRLKIDPALATGPFITTFNDIVGLFIYFGLGRALYGMF